MRVLVSPQTERGHAVGAYRLWWPAEALQAQGHDVTIVPPHGGSGPIVDARDFDALVIQRPRREIDFHVMRALQSMGVAVIVDIDDDLHALHPDNAARFAPILDDPSYGKGWVAKCCRNADLVTVSTRALQERYARHGRCVVVPNRVPARYLDITAKRKKTLTVGWAGSLNVHPDDLQVTEGQVGRMIRDTGCRFHVIGTGVGVRDALDLPQEPTHTGWVPLADYPAQVAKLDIGIVPLADTVFNAAKSALKMSEMAALGVIPVVSPTPDNLRLVAAGVGATASSPAEWRDRLTNLHDLEWSVLRHLAAQARTVMRGHTIEGNTSSWWDAWSLAVENRKSALTRVPA